MTWQQQSTEGKHATECLLVSRRLLLLSRLFWKNGSHPLYTFNRLCTTHTHTLYYNNLAIQIVHSLRTNTNKKITEIQCFISDFLSHILTMLQCIVSDTVNKFSHFCSKQQNVMHVCIIAVCLPLLRGSELPLFPQMLYPEKQKAKENKTMRTRAHT